MDKEKPASRLVLTRRPGQALMIGDNVEVYISEVRGDVVRLSIQAPRSVAILRREVLDAIQAENREAAEADTELLVSLSSLAAAEPSGEEEAAPAPSKPHLKIS